MVEDSVWGGYMHVKCSTMDYFQIEQHQQQKMNRVINKEQDTYLENPHFSSKEGLSYLEDDVYNRCVRDKRQIKNMLSSTTIELVQTLVDETKVY